MPSSDPLPSWRQGTTRQAILDFLDQADDIETLVETVHAHAPNVPIRKTRHAPETLWRIKENSEIPVSELAGKKITAACAIGVCGFRG